MYWRAHAAKVCDFISQIVPLSERSSLACTRASLFKVAAKFSIFSYQAQYSRIIKRIISRVACLSSAQLMTRRFNIVENILKIANPVGDSPLMSILLFISPLAAMYILLLSIRSFLYWRYSSVY